MAEFTIADLPKIFGNIREAKNKPPLYDFAFIVREHKKGGDSAEILYCSEFKELAVIVDNFPNKRKHYKTTFPIKTFEKFEELMTLIEIELIPNY